LLEICIVGWITRLDSAIRIVSAIRDTRITRYYGAIKVMTAFIWIVSITRVIRFTELIMRL
jgi:hypothetical protein